MKWLLIALGLLAFYYLFLRPEPRLRTPGQHQSNWPLLFRGLLASTRAGAVLHVEHEGSERHFRIRKEITADGARRLRFELPEAGWATGSLGAVAEALERAGFQPVLARVAHAPEAGETEPQVSLLEVRSLTATRAFQAAEQARMALGLPLDARYTIWYGGLPSVTELRRYGERGEAPDDHRDGSGDSAAV